MKKLGDLLAELCPNGVEYKALENVSEIKRGIRVVKSQLNQNEKYPVYQNSLTPLGFFEKTNAPANTTFIIVAGAAGEIGYSTCDFWAADDCFYFLPSAKLLGRYIYHFLLMKQEYLRSKVRKASIPRLSRSAIEKLEIPVPPLEIQQEIVRILDQFTGLTAELTTQLTAELIARKQQYEYYRDELLTFGDTVEYKTTSELKEDSFWLMPATPQYVDTGIPYITSKNIKNGLIDFQNVKFISEEDYKKISSNRVIQKDDLLITMIDTIGEAAFVGEYTEFYGQNMYLVRLDQNIINRKFFYYFITSDRIKNRLVTKKNTSSQGYIKAGNIENLKIPLPPIEEQNRIVSILDRFDTLCNDLTSGLPAEIESRRKQYEYYRDKLLNFEEKN